MIGLGNIQQYKYNNGVYGKRYITRHGYNNRALMTYYTITNMVNGYGYGLYHTYTYNGLSSIDYYDLTDTLIGYCYCIENFVNNSVYYL